MDAEGKASMFYIKVDDPATTMLSFRRFMRRTAWKITRSRAG